MEFYGSAQEKKCVSCGATFWTFVVKAKRCWRCCQAATKKAGRTRNKKREQAGQLILIGANDATNID